MAIAISLGYLDSVLAANGGTLSFDQLTALYNTPSGIPQLDASGKISDDMLPPSVISLFLGTFDQLATLREQHPTAAYGEYAIVYGDVYYYNAARDGGSWSSVYVQPFFLADLTPEVLAGQPEWVITPNPA